MRAGEGRKTMRYDDQRPSSGDTAKVGINNGLTFGIQRTGRFIQNKQLGIDEQRTRDGKSLTLSTRQICRALIDQRVVSARQAFNEFLRASQACCGDYLFKAGAGISRSHVVTNRA